MVTNANEGATAADRSRTPLDANAQAVRTLSRPIALWYSAGQLAEGLKNESFALFLLFYYTQVVGLSGVLTGQAILVALIFDAVTDPMTGTLSDRLNSRWGRRHPFLYASALPLAITFYFTFVPPEGLSELQTFAWLTTFLILCRGSMTLFHVPHLSLGAELTTDYVARTRLVTTRFYFARAGHAMAAILGLLVFMRPTDDFPNGQLNPAAYPPFALTLSIAMFFIILLSAAKTHACIPRLTAPPAGAMKGSVLRSLVGGMIESLRLRSFRALFLGTTMTFVGWGITSALSLHFATYFWHISLAQMVFFGIGAGVGIFFGLGFWERVARTREKKWVFIAGLAIFTVFSVSPPLMKIAGWWPPEDSPFYVPLFVLTAGLLANLGIASTMVTGQSMMGDVTDEDALAVGHRREGIFFGASSFAAKASFGVGSLIAGILLDAIGLTKNITPETAPPSIERDLGLTLGISLLVFVGLSIGFFSRYDMTRTRHDLVLAGLEEQRARALEATDQLPD